MKSVRLPPPPARDPGTDPLAVALVDEVVERGYAAATVAGVVARAGVDQEEFDRRFVDLEDCALRSHEAFIAAFERRIGLAYNAEAEWRDALRAAAYETADWIAEHPNQTRFGMVEVLEMRSEMARVRREEVFVYCAQMIDAGREKAADPAAVPESASIVAIGSITQLLAHRVQKGVPVDPHAMVPEMMYMVTRPYIGEELARQELTLPRPPRHRLS